MIWGVISEDGRMDFNIFCNFNFLIQKCAEKIPRSLAIPDTTAIDDSFHLTYDVTRPHKALLLESMVRTEINIVYLISIFLVWRKYDRAYWNVRSIDLCLCELYRTYGFHFLKGGGDFPNILWNTTWYPLKHTWTLLDVREIRTPY